jgi:hypothetical protein
VENGTEPFAAGYEDLVGRADDALDVPLQSVVDDDNDNYGPHRFEADTNDRADYRAGLGMSAAARDCALVYRFTGEAEYAERVVDILHHWFLADATYMEPNSVIPNASGAIRQHIWVPSFVYAAAFVRDHPHWDTYDGSRPWDDGQSAGAEAAFGQWLVDWHDTFPDSRPEWCPTNNRWAWRIANKAAVAAYLGNGSLMELAKRMYTAEAETTCPDGSTEKPRPWDDYVSVSEDTGYFNAERGRENAFQYTGYNLLGHAMCCTAFDVWDGTDLWNFNAPTDPTPGSTLWKAFNWYLPYVRNTSTWQWNQTGISDGDIEQAAAAYELAYARWNDFEEGIDSPDRIGVRPHTDRRILGPITLTHGEY